MQVSNSSPSQQLPIISESKADSTEAAGDFQTFLTLLTAQMRNQDPMKPMDSTEFVAQLANFSSVEQQIETNKKLDTIVSTLTNNPVSRMADWIGKETQHSGSTMFDGTPIEIGIPPLPSADFLQLVVRDEGNNILKTTSIAPNTSMAIWDGNTSTGTRAPTGRYRFEIESFSDGKLIETTPGHVFDMVTEVRNNDGNVTLVFESGDTIAVDEVTALRATNLP